MRPGYVSVQTGPFSCNAICLTRARQGLEQGMIPVRLELLGVFVLNIHALTYSRYNIHRCDGFR